MDNLVQRLREEALRHDGCGEYHSAIRIREAADEIERLQERADAGAESWNALQRTLAEIERLRVQIAERDRDAERLLEALRDAMYQATEYDGLELRTIGPQHWYTKAAAIDAAMSTASATSPPQPQSNPPASGSCTA